MKKLAIVVALSVPFILPAQGQSYSFTWGQEQSASDFAQAKKSQKAKQKTAKQRVAKQPRAAAKPCVAYHWTGCLGWDPDPLVRAMILHDRNIYDD